jgi:hypothetical protein
MKLVKLTIALIAIAGVTINASHLSKAAERKPPVAYFQTSNDADVPINVPADAKDVVVAKVRFLMKAAWLGGHHCEGCTNDILFTRVKISILHGEGPFVRALTQDVANWRL